MSHRVERKEQPNLRLPPPFFNKTQDRFTESVLTLDNLGTYCPYAPTYSSIDTDGTPLQALPPLDLLKQLPPLNSIISLTLENCTCSTEQLKALMTKTPYLSTLSLTNCPSLKTLPLFPETTLKSLMLTKCTSLDFSSLAEFLQAHKENLETVHLNALNLEDATIDSLVSLSSLRVLELNSNPKLTAKAIASLLTKLPSLRSLWLIQCNLTLQQIKQHYKVDPIPIHFAPQHFPPLPEVKIPFVTAQLIQEMWKEKAPHSQEDTPLLKELLPLLPWHHVRFLDLSFSSFPPSYFTTLFPRLKKLEQLTLYRLTEEITLENGAAFKHLSSLSLLRIGECNIPHEETLPTLLQFCPFLHTLHLKKFKLNTSIFKVIAALPKLTELNMSCCNFSLNSLNLLSKLQKITFCYVKETLLLPLPSIQEAFAKIADTSTVIALPPVSNEIQAYAHRLANTSSPAIENKQPDFYEKQLATYGLHPSKNPLVDELTLQGLYNTSRVFHSITENLIQTTLFLDHPEYHPPANPPELIFLLQEEIVRSYIYSLNLNDLDLTYLPPFLLDLPFPHVNFINLNNNALTAFPLNPAHFPHLKTLTLQNNAFTELPRALFHFSELTRLDVSRNPIATLLRLPPALPLETLVLAHLLEPLDIRQEFWDSLHHLTHLTLLDLSGNKLLPPFFPKKLFLTILT